MGRPLTEMYATDVSWKERIQMNGSSWEGASQHMALKRLEAAKMAPLVSYGEGARVVAKVWSRRGYPRGHRRRWIVLHRSTPKRSISIPVKHSMFRVQWTSKCGRRQHWMKESGRLTGDRPETFRVCPFLEQSEAKQAKAAPAKPNGRPVTVIPTVTLPYF
jgi:hypothetical protein